MKNGTPDFVFGLAFELADDVTGGGTNNGGCNFSVSAFIGGGKKVGNARLFVSGALGGIKVGGGKY